jgi:3-phosphoinositide dependent protein kinase-1
MHLKLTDFGTTKQLEGGDAKNARSNSFVGTAEYVSPELLNVKETCAASDLWALGVIVFQFLTGRMAFHGPTQYVTFQNVIHRRIEYPQEEFPEHAKDLCESLLKMEPDERLGAGPGGYAKLKAHPLFEGIDWQNLASSTPPSAAAHPTKWTWASDEKAAAEKAAADAETGGDSASSPSSSAGGGGDKRASLASSAASSSSSSSSDLEQNYNKQATEQWSKHLNKGEHALKAGVIWKRRKMSVKKRMLLLTDRPRLVYIDMRADETMGEIPFTADMKLDVKGKKIFHIKTPGRRWILEDSSKNAQLWVSAIQVQHRRFMSSTQ